MNYPCPDNALPLISVVAGGERGRKRGAGMRRGKKWTRDWEGEEGGKRGEGRGKCGGSGTSGGGGRDKRKGEGEGGQTEGREAEGEGEGQAERVEGDKQQKERQTIRGKGGAEGAQRGEEGSNLRFDANKHLFSEGEKNVDLSCPLQFNTLLASLHAASKSTSLFPLFLFLKPILKFWSVGISLMRFTWANHSERRILNSNFSVAYNDFRELYTSNQFPYV